MLLCLFGHCIQSTPIFEPLDLACIEGMVERGIPYLPIFGVDSQGDGFADGDFGTEEIDPVIRIDLVIVGWIRKGEREHALFFEVGLVLFRGSANLYSRND